jgi:hypothetical protein
LEKRICSPAPPLIKKLGSMLLVPSTGVVTPLASQNPPLQEPPIIAFRGSELAADRGEWRWCRSNAAGLFSDNTGRLLHVLGLDDASWWSKFGSAVRRDWNMPETVRAST